MMHNQRARISLACFVRGRRCVDANGDLIAQALIIDHTLPKGNQYRDEADDLHDDADKPWQLRQATGERIRVLQVVFFDAFLLVMINIEMALM